MMGVGNLQLMIGGLLKVTNFVLSKVGLGNDMVQGYADATFDAGAKNTVGTLKKRWDTGLGFGDKKYEKGTDNLMTNFGRLGQNFRGLGYAVGIGDEGEDKKSDEKDIEKKRRGLAMLLEDKRRLTAESAVYDDLLEKNGKLTARQEHDRLVLANQYRAVQRDIGEEADALRTAEDDYRKKYGRAFEGTKDTSKKPRTAEEIKNQLDSLKAQRELDLKRTLASTPKVAEMESAIAVTEAYQKQLNIAHEINDLIANNGWNLQTQAEYAKKAQEASNTLIEKEKEHAFFLHKQAVALAEAKRGRTEGLIASDEKREQTYMARKGMTGMDKQSVMVSNAVEKMVRDQEQLERVMNDPSKTQADREAAKGVVDASALKAQDELDKLSLMQFQYSASDAAKKGMGGGIDIRENQLTVAKSQLDILKQQLDLMRSQYGVDLSNYGGTPMIMQGPYRAGK